MCNGTLTGPAQIFSTAEESVVPRKEHCLIMTMRMFLMEHIFWELQKFPEEF
jgi:hypothetical protein